MPWHDAIKYVSELIEGQDQRHYADIAGLKADIKRVEEDMLDTKLWRAKFMGMMLVAQVIGGAGTAILVAWITHAIK